MEQYGSTFGVGTHSFCICHRAKSLTLLCTKHVNILTIFQK